ncbi:MAG: NfeD family protein [Rivularia sp. (in: cyanobacteria)]
MNFQIILIALIAIAIGVAVGFFIVSLIALRRQREVVDSMVSTNILIGRLAVVEVPFSSTEKGKVRLAIHGSTIDFTAITEESGFFNKGDRVLIVEARRNQVLVVSEDSLNS